MEDDGESGSAAGQAVTGDNRGPRERAARRAAADFNEQIATKLGEGGMMAALGVALTGSILRLGIEVAAAVDELSQIADGMLSAAHETEGIRREIRDLCENLSAVIREGRPR